MEASVSAGEFGYSREREYAPPTGPCKDKGLVFVAEAREVEELGEREMCLHVPRGPFEPTFKFRTF